MTAWSRKLHNEDSHKIYSSLNTIRVIKANRMKWARHAAQLEQKNCMLGRIYLKDIEYLEYVSADGDILKRISDD